MTFINNSTMITIDASEASTGMAALQKRIMALPRKIESCTHGVWQAWEDTFMNWDSSTKYLSQYPKNKNEFASNQAEVFHRISKRRASHHSEKNLVFILCPFINMSSYFIEN